MLMVQMGVGRRSMRVMVSISLRREAVIASLVPIVEWRKIVFVLFYTEYWPGW